MRKLTIITAFFMLFTLCSFAQNDTWNRFASKDAVWSTLRPFGFNLSIVSVAGNECELKGGISDSGVALKLKGKAWFEDNEIKFKLTSKSILDFKHGIQKANTTIAGTIKAVDLNEIEEFYDILKHEYKYKYHEAYVELSAEITMSNGNFEIPSKFEITLCNSEIFEVLDRKAKKEAAKKEAEEKAAEEEKRQAEIKRRNTPEYQCKFNFDFLLGAERIGFVTKKKFNSDKVLSSVTSNNVAGLTETIDSDTIIDVLKYNDESIAGRGKFKNLTLSCRTKLPCDIQCQFVDKYIFETENPKAEIVAYYTPDFKTFLFVTRVNSNCTAFLYSSYNDMPIKLDKKTQELIIQQTFNSEKRTVKH